MTIVDRGVKVRVDRRWIAVMGLVVVVVGLVVSFGRLEESAPLPQLGDAAVDFTLTDRQGRSVRLSSLRGKVVLLNFWATWCPPCRQEMPSMERLHQLMDGERFVLLAVNVEQNGPRAVAEYLGSQPVGFSILFDPQHRVSQAYGVAKYPETFVIDPNGIIVEKVVGAIDWSQPQVMRYLQALLAP